MLVVNYRVIVLAMKETCYNTLDTKKPKLFNDLNLFDKTIQLVALS